MKGKSGKVGVSLNDPVTNMPAVAAAALFRNFRLEMRGKLIFYPMNPVL